MFCLLEEDLVLGVNCQQALELRLLEFLIVEVAQLNTSRLWPGIIRVRDFAYVFGGNTSYALTSCEKYHVKVKEWRNIGDMHGPKSCFTPCLVRNEVYLCCFNPDSKPFEAFNPVTETFRELPVSYKSSLFGSVTFLVADTLYIVAYEGVLLKWQLSKLSLDPALQIDLQGDKNSGSSNIPPMQEGKHVYWVNYNNRQLIEFDLEENSIVKR